jgi:hypothetical protein
MYFTGTLKRLSTTDKSGHLRSGDVKGSFEDPPKVGRSFVLLGPPHAESFPGTFARLVSTSPVTRVWDGLVAVPGEISRGDVYHFYTDSGSEYQLEVE